MKLQTNNINLKVEVQYAQGICHVHYYTGGDIQSRDIYYCGKCDAWICKDCRPKLLLRAEAMAIVVAKKLKYKMTIDGFNLFPVYFQGQLINQKKN